MALAREPHHSDVIGQPVPDENYPRVTFPINPWVCAYSPSMIEIRGASGSAVDKTEPWYSTIGCTDWKKAQWQAEFKGIPFAVESDTRTGGRRIQVHEYPSREYWDNEDLGRLRQQIDVQAYVFGDRSDLWAEQLFAACTSPGYSRLFLPMRTPLSAVCISVESNFRADQMGRIAFSMNFSIEPGIKAGQLKQRTVTKTQLMADAINSISGVASSARLTYEIRSTGTPAVAHSTTAEFIRQVGLSLRTVAKSSWLDAVSNSDIELIVNRMLTEADNLATLPRSTANTMTRTAAMMSQRPPNIDYFPIHGAGVGIRTSTGEVLPQPGGANEGFGGLFEKAMGILNNGSKNPSDLAQALIPLTSFAPTILRATVAASGKTASVEAEIKMVEALASYVRRISLTNSILAGMKVAPERQPDASLTRKQLLDQLDNEIAIAMIDPKVREELRKLRVSVVTFVSHFSIGGAAAVPIPAAWANKPLACVAANAYVHGAVKDRDREIMRFNGVTHPLFPNGRIDVLADKSMRITSDIT